MSEEKKFRLPKEFGTEWLNALRSGNYIQAIETLYNPTTKGFCCLGVACSLKYPLHYLKSKEGVYAEIIRDLKDDDFGTTKFNLNKIPNELKGDVRYNKLVRELVYLNDKKTSFPEIADWIEKNVEFYE